MGKWKCNPGDIVVANEEAPGDYRGRQATIIGHGPGIAEYTVNFNGQIAYLNSWWLDRLENEQGR
jgi:hypothetical protein